MEYSSSCCHKIVFNNKSSMPNESVNPSNGSAIRPKGLIVREAQSLTSVPSEVLRMILSQTDLETLESLCLVDTKTQSVCKDQIFWKEKYENDFVKGQQLITGLSWKQMYELEYFRRLIGYEGKLENLLEDTTTLFINNKNITYIPPVFKLLSHLENVDFGDNKLTSFNFQLPDELEILSLTKNKLKNFPNITGGLKKLFLNQNQISVDINEQFPNIPNLELLNVSFNKISIIPDSFSTSFPKLKILVLRKNKLTNFPESILNLSELQELYIDENDIKNIPNGIKKLQKLETLGLTNCGLSILPNEIENLSRLKVLGLTNNQLTKLPSSISKLERLERLAISDNNLTILPETMAFNTRLNYIVVDKNVIIPDAVAKKPGLRILVKN